MGRVDEKKKVKGKQSKYVNSNVKEFDSEIWGTGTNLFGETAEEMMPEKFKQIIQLGNLHTDRVKYTNPQDYRVYSPKGCCPTLQLSATPNFLMINDGEYIVRALSGIEAMRMMGVEDEDIQKLIDGGMNNTQLIQLAGNSIIVDCMSTFFKEMIKH